MGFQEVAKYYYYPSWQQFTMISLIINLRSWNELSAYQQQLIEQVCHDNFLWCISKDKQLTRSALGELRRQGVTVRNIPDDIQYAAKLAWNEVAQDLSNKTPDFARTYASYKAYNPSSTLVAEQKTHRPKPASLHSSKSEDKTRPSQSSSSVASKGDSQSAMIEIEPIDEEYVAKKKSNIRKLPDVKSERIGALLRGQTVTALGKVVGKNWILVAKDGKHEDSGKSLDWDSVRL